MGEVSGTARRSEGVHGDLRRIFGRAEGAGRLLAFCPYHKDLNRPALGIWADHVYCFACRAWRSADQFLREHDPATIHVVEWGRGSGGSAPRVRYLPASLARAYAEILATTQRPRRSWLYSRGLTDATIDRFQLGHSGAAFSIPIYGESGQLVGIRFRRDDQYDDGSPKYWGLCGYNTTCLYDPSKLLLPSNVVLGRGRSYLRPQLILCEGELDALLCVQEGLPAVAFTNGTSGVNRDTMRLLDGARLVAIALDQDRAGRDAAARAAAWLGGRGRILRWEGAKDVTELYQRGRWTELVKQWTNLLCSS